MNEKELKQIYKFYKNSKDGFVTPDGYAAVRYGKKQFVIIYNGQQLEVVNTQLQAKNFIKKHRTFQDM